MLCNERCFFRRACNAQSQRGRARDAARSVEVPLRCAHLHESLQKERVRDGADQPIARRAKGHVARGAHARATARKPCDGACTGALAATVQPRRYLEGFRCGRQECCLSSLYPPPPPSSRRSNAGPPGTVHSDPSSGSEGSAGVLTGAAGAAESLPGALLRAPDSLVPVRYTDLLTETSPDAQPGRSRRARAAVPVLAAFVAGAGVVLAVQTSFTRAEARADTSRAASPTIPRTNESPLPAAVAPPMGRPGTPPVASLPATPAALAGGAPAQIVTSEISVGAPKAAQPAAAATPAATASGARPATQPEQPANAPDPLIAAREHRPEPVAHRRMRTRHPTGPRANEPPTAVFPD